MKYLLILLVLPFLSASECGKKEKEKEAKTDTVAPVKEDEKPAVVENGNLLPCLQKIIDEENKRTPPDGPLQITEYLYNDKTYYLFTAPCCDQFNTLYDDSCRMICAPTGGFTGRGDGKCPDFSKTAKLVKVVYKKAD